MHPPPVCNTTLETNHISELPITGSSTFHQIALYIVTGLTFLTLVTSLTLMAAHATHYSRPWEQKHIMRILFMLPVYAISCLLITGFYRNYIYFTIIYQLYEPIAVVSYLTLIVHYVQPTEEAQGAWLETQNARPWVFPLSAMYSCTGGQKGPFRTPRTAMTQFNIIWFFVYQYCVVRLICAVAALITQGVGRYCQASLSPYFAHIWLTIITALSIAVAMYCLIQAHLSVRQKLNHHTVDSKLLCLKLVVFFSFWQAIVFGIAGSKIADHVNPYIGQTDIQVVLQYLLLSTELLVFALLHIRAYSWKPYILAPKSNNYSGGRFGWRAFADCFNIIDVARAIRRGFHWMIIARKYRNSALKTEGLDAQSHYDARDEVFEAVQNTPGTLKV